MEDIVKYADAAPELKSKMDAVMEVIDKNPTDLGGIINFGVAPVMKLGNLAKEITPLFRKIKCFKGSRRSERNRNIASAVS